MGSFPSTCSLSGLPIEQTEPVRAFLLVECPYTEMGTRAFSWIPRTYPLAAKYDGYGGIDHVEDGPQREVWLDGIQLDALGRGWGSNPVHDVPVRKKMSFNGLLRVLRENRLLVSPKSRDVKLEDTTKELEKILPLVRPPRKKLPEGVPTRSRVEKLFRAKNLPLYESGDRAEGVLGSAGYLVVKTGCGVRVKWQSWGTEEQAPAVHLERAREILSERYATMNTAWGVLVAPKPDAAVHAPWLNSGVKKPGRKVELAFIRNDVWRAVLKVPIPRTFDPPDPIGHDWFGMIGLGTHTYLLEKRLRPAPLPPDFLQTAKDFAHIRCLLVSVRGAWFPSASRHGPQFPIWPTHARWLQALATVAQNHRSVPP